MRRADLWRLARFVLVGGCSALIYFATVSGLVFVGMDARLAALVAYVISMSLSYIGHRYVTFGSRSRPAPEGARFAVSHLLGMTVMFGTMYLAVSVLRLPYWVGTALGTVLVPVLSFVLLSLWVFRTHEPRTPSGRQD